MSVLVSTPASNPLWIDTSTINLVVYVGRVLVAPVQNRSGFRQGRNGEIPSRRFKVCTMRSEADERRSTPQTQSARTEASRRPRGRENRLMRIPFRALAFVLREVSDRLGVRSGDLVRTERLGGFAG